jgi:hypothetical protein
MIVLFVVFVFFAVALPVALEERRHRGDNILKRTGVEILNSRPVRRLGITVGEARHAVSAIVATLLTLFLFFVALLGLLGILIRFLSR